MLLGRDKCWQKISERFYWYGGQKFVAQKTRECSICAQKNDQHWPANVAPLKSIEKVPMPMAQIHLDCVQSLGTTSTDGNKFVIIGVCAFTKYVEAARKYFCFRSQNLPTFKILAHCFFVVEKIPGQIFVAH